MKPALVFIQRRGRKGGSQVALVDLINNLTNHYQITVITEIFGRRWLASAARANGATVHAIPYNSPGSIVGKSTAFFTNLWATILIKDIRPALIVANDFMEAKLANGISKNLGIPFAVILRSPQMSLTQFKKYQCDKAALLFYTNRYHAHTWKDLLGASAPLHILSDGLNRTFPFNSSPANNSAAKGLCWLIIGDTSPRKGWKSCIEALNQFDNAFTKPLNLEITFAIKIQDSDHINRPTPRNFKIAYGEYNETMLDFMRTFDLIINPSLSETFGLAALEAAAIGKPVVSSRVGILPYMLPPDRLYAPGDSENLKNILLDAINNWKNFVADSAINTTIEKIRKECSAPDHQKEIKLALTELHPKITTTIITKNEIDTINACVRSWSDLGQVIVLDSGSTDGTRDAAAQAGALVFERTWTNYADQKNAAAQLANTDWVLSIDADEIATPHLIESIRATPITSPKNAYRIKRDNHFCGKKVRYSGWGNDRVVRLYNRNHSKFAKRTVHEKLIAEGCIRDLEGELLHFPYRSRETIELKTKHYARLAAEQLLNSRVTRSNVPVFVRAAWSFARTYFFKLGILDGAAGLEIALMNYRYTYLKYSHLANQSSI